MTDAPADAAPSTDPSAFLPPPAHPPVAGPEVEMLLGELERVRGYVRWKCSGVDADGMRKRLGPSALTLGGLLKHLALVEDHWFGVRLLGRPASEPWASVDFDADPEWEFRTAADDSPDELLALWEASCESSRRWLAEALADGGLDYPAAVTGRDGRAPDTRRIVVDMVEEYARHLGHIDLLRENVDGLTGEDPGR
ncbi:DinB family protein [Intrasporangium flavum]|uniref:DinB family protein n=1 Tax=Intrasporangium flavum TaxID=1428657 RepID=UPI0009F96091|nr:DinB family protein [Intrasporangium flavum]